MSLDGYIAGPNGEYDWIVHDPDIDFGEIFRQFDTLVMGRGTYEAGLEIGSAVAMPGVSTIVISSTLQPADHPKVTIATDVKAVIDDLKATPGKDIWLFGGGQLFRSCLELGLVDGVDAAVIPVMLGRGIPFLPSPGPQTSLRLREHRLYPKSGIVSLEYDVVRSG